PKEHLEELLTFVTSNQVAPYQLGIYENKIFLSYRTHLSDIYSLKKDEIKNNMIRLALKADELDDVFKDKYGCEMSMESKSDNVNLVATVQQEATDKEEVIQKNDVVEQTGNPIEKLKKLKEMFEMELISESEYIESKKAILSSM
ncbi:MAG TPA: hypothetical protein DEO36_05655, partial [Flavobacteriaceae bacterium]|nr:hypothetical protein [Flavobacteriaceae bacterium]